MDDYLNRITDNVTKKLRSQRIAKDVIVPKKSSIDIELENITLYFKLPHRTDHIKLTFSNDSPFSTIVKKIKQVGINTDSYLMFIRSDGEVMQCPPSLPISECNLKSGDTLVVAII